MQKSSRFFNSGSLWRRLWWIAPKGWGGGRGYAKLGFYSYRRVCVSCAGGYSVVFMCACTSVCRPRLFSDTDCFCCQFFSVVLIYFWCYLLVLAVPL
ncbi:hypothetical protein GQ43DRAFT_162490 [Delitschia confertaspora ATCC 74209]|uniref:Uncharacterized protein n=1 Tax=Delitschia confertaspora ATCC 74209 TaxID=1513339 RepID=A0A9P4JHL4_9PLEO|nr:hypothetical protein GQ43DRAFT_162490 [Delitschia confertaspora ATCC 74209]